MFKSFAARRKMGGLGVGVVAALAVSFASPASATLIISASVDALPAFTCVDNDMSCDTNPATGQIGLAPTLFGAISVTGNFERSVKGLPDLLASSATSVINTATSGPAVPITVAVGDTDFIGPTSTIDTSGSGLFTLNQGDGITLNWYADTANGQGALSATTTPGTLVDTYSFTPTLDTQSFSHNAQGIPFSANTPFSMTEQFSFSLLPGASLTSRGQTEIANVSEPGSLAVLGTVLAGMGWLRRRKRSRANPATV